jgi:hypothetical protein
MEIIMSNPVTLHQFEVHACQIFDAHDAHSRPELAGIGYFEIVSDSRSRCTGYSLKYPKTYIFLRLTNLAETELANLVDTGLYVKVCIQHVPNDYGAETFAHDSQVKIIHVFG